MRVANFKRPLKMFQHTAARRRLLTYQPFDLDCSGFQHTAARRRQLVKYIGDNLILIVSTHSRTKAAAVAINSSNFI